MAAAVEAKGLEVRKLKSEKADKALITAAVAELLDLKKKLAENPNGKLEAPKKTAEPVDWEKSLVATKFDFYDYKTLFVNAKDKKEALEKLWSDECWDDKALSFWKLEYEKASAKEGEKLHVNNNMLNGFIQRMDDKVRKHSLGCFGVYGDEPNLDQKGLMLWRGTEVPGVLKDHPSIEYWKKTKLDIKDPKNKALILQYLTTPEGGKVEGKSVQSF